MRSGSINSIREMDRGSGYFGVAFCSISFYKITIMRIILIMVICFNVFSNLMSKKIKAYFLTIGTFGFLFFLLKGLAWLAIFYFGFSFFD